MQLSVCLQEFVFGTLTEWLHIYNIYLYCSLWVLNGLLQSAVWPCVVAVMGNWFGKTGCVTSSFVYYQLNGLCVKKIND